MEQKQKGKTIEMKVSNPLTSLVDLPSSSSNNDLHNSLLFLIGYSLVALSSDKKDNMAQGEDRYIFSVQCDSQRFLPRP